MFSELKKYYLITATLRTRRPGVLLIPKIRLNLSAHLSMRSFTVALLLMPRSFAI